MAVPKATETRYRYGSVQARQAIKSIHKQPHPDIFFYTSSSSANLAMRLLRISVCSLKKCRDGVACVVFL